jgi:AraC family transcriptional activator of pobA
MICYDADSIFRKRHMGLIKDVPVYKLYGEQEQWTAPDMVHFESIAARSQLHNWEIKPHQHHGLFQILHLKQGQARVRLDDRHQEMHAGQILMVPQMCIHGFKFAPGADGQVMTMAYPLIYKISRHLGDALAALSGPYIHDLDDEPESRHISMALSALAQEYKSSAQYRILLIESLLGTILAWLMRHAHSHFQEASDDLNRGESHFGNFCQLIDECHARHHPVAWYAKKIGITAAHLNVLCRQAVNQSALELIHERMVLEAKRDLVYTSMTVSVISYALGFSDPAYFTRFFKRQVGQSPREFRKNAQVMYTEEKWTALPA